MRDRGDGSSGRTIRGYAYVFDKLSGDLGGFRERIDRGAGLDSLSGDDVYATYNHNDSAVLARSGAGLRTGEDERGGWYEIDLPDTSTGRDVAELVDRGVLHGSSFAFTVESPDADQTYTRDEKSGELIRTLKRFRVHELGPVTRPAYPDTTVARRSIPGSLTAARTTPGGVALPETVETVAEERKHVEHQLQTASDERRDDRVDRLLSVLDRLDGRFAELDVTGAAERQAEQHAADMREVVKAMRAPGYSNAAAQDDGAVLRALREGESTEFRATMGVTVDVQNKQSGKAVPLRTLHTLLTKLIGERSTYIAGGATTLETSSGEVIDHPRVRPTRPTAKVAEGAPIPENYPSTDTVPLGVEKYGYVSHVSNELIQDDHVDLVGFLSRDMAPNLADQMGRDFAAALLSPTTGVTPEMRITLTAAARDTVITDAVIDLYYTLASAQAERAQWLMGRRTVGRVRKLKDAEGRYLLKSAVDGSSLALMGRPVSLDPAFTDHAEQVLYLGDLSGFTVRYAGGYRIARSTEVKFLEDLTSFKVVRRAGAVLIDTTGSALLTLPAPAGAGAASK
ncbi:phage major capsid protein [Crossiella sp. CA198]|uniref:phage major capsid protein n=1 Tax=Crossiella sp. CA198 TaxID=3455607 RepID=UPI003F8D5728